MMRRIHLSLHVELVSLVGELGMFHEDAKQGLASGMAQTGPAVPMLLPAFPSLGAGSMAKTFRHDVPSPGPDERLPLGGRRERSP